MNGLPATPEQIERTAESLTGKYISGEVNIGARFEPRQANGKAITTSDELLQDTLNLKR